MGTTDRNWNERHLGEEELTGLLYETAPFNAHLDACLHCKGRMLAMERRRAMASEAEGPAVSEFVLAQQRARIYSQLDSRPASRLGSRKLWIWAGAPVAAAAAFFVTVSLRTVTPEPVATPVAVMQESDTLYSDIYQTVSQETPSGVYAVAAMFEPVSTETGVE